MRTPICQRLDIEFPIFAFTHCRDVVAAVSNAGGMGVLGAVGFSPEQLAVELEWLDEHVADGKTYGVDVVIPEKYEGMDEIDPAQLEADLAEMIPEETRAFAQKLLADEGVPEIPEDERDFAELLGFGALMAQPLIEEALAHEKCSLIANALGTPPDDIVTLVHESGRAIGALCGSAKHALAHKEAGLDFVVCQGGEGGGHTGDVGSIVLWPEVIDAVGPDMPRPGGRRYRQRSTDGGGHGHGRPGSLDGFALAHRRGSRRPAGPDAEVPRGGHARHGAVDVRGPGSQRRMLRNKWTDAWDDPSTPAPLGMPLQTMVTVDAMARGHRYPEQAVDVNFYPAGQVIGLTDKPRRTADVIYSLVEEFIDAGQRMQKLLET